MLKKLKSEKHHWWPECVSKHWAGQDGKTGWLKPDGSCIRVPPAKLGAIGNGHHIKMSNCGEGSPWDQSFEHVFDKADSRFPDLLRWLNGLERRTVPDARSLRERFVPQPSADEQLLWMTEFAVSLAVRSPKNREASVAIAEDIRGPLPGPERNALIGLNMRNSQRVVADSIGARGKYVAVFSQGREFVFGDGFFHNVSNAQNAPFNPKLFVPLTPHLCILVCRPMRFMVEPKLCTLVLADEEVEVCNSAVQVYAKNAIFFREERPEIRDDFRLGEHRRYDDPRNPIDELVENIPGVPPRDPSMDWWYDKRRTR